VRTPGPPYVTQSSRPASSVCSTRYNDGRMPLSDDSIGSLYLWSPLRQLKAECAAARDTTLVGEQGLSVRGVVFPFPGGLTAVASQHRAELTTEDPADGWIVQGVVLLAGRVSTQRSWGELVQHLGRSVTNASDGPALGAFCDMPRVVLELDPPDEWWELGDESAPLPLETRVKGIGVLSREQYRAQLPVSLLRC
jgi:hypothetical protein